MMLRSLRRRFIIVAMSSLFLVLIIIIGGINILNYRVMIEEKNILLDIIADNGGNLPKDTDGPPVIYHDVGSVPPYLFFPEKIKNSLMNKISIEMPFNSRFFTVTIDPDGETNGRAGKVVSVNTSNIASVSDEQASKYALWLFRTGESSGFYGLYKYTMTEHNDGTMYIFLDCGSDLVAFRYSVIVSTALSVVGFIMVFLLVLILSSIIFKPVSDSYNKQKRFITDASHEIKTPLTIIGANTDVIEMTNGQNEWTKSIKNQVGRLNALTKDLILLSRMDEESTRLSFVEFSLSDVVTEMAESYRTLAEASNKSFALTISPDIMYKGNEKSIRQLISVLLDNAIKYSDDNGSIYISLSSISNLMGKRRILTVKNSVSSIRVGDHDELFERFYRSDSSRNSEMGGHGIGLSIAKAITSVHKGSISASSSDGKSIEFTVIL